MVQDKYVDGPHYWQTLYIATQPSIQAHTVVYYCKAQRPSALDVSMVQSRSLPFSLNPNWPHYVSFASIAAAIFLGFIRFAFLGEFTIPPTTKRSFLRSVKTYPTLDAVTLC